MKPDYAVQIFWSKEDGAYLAAPFELPGCIADGKTQEEALSNIRVVIAEWIEVAKEEGREVPAPMSQEDFEKFAKECDAKFKEQLQKEITDVIKSVTQHLREQQQPVQFRRMGFVATELEPACGPSRRR